MHATMVFDVKTITSQREKLFVTVCKVIAKSSKTYFLGVSGKKGVPYTS